MRRTINLAAALTTFAVPIGLSADIVIQNARLIDGTGAPPVEGATIVVANDRIVSVDGSGANGNETAIDASGRTVMPGLSELHVHSTVEFWTDLEPENFYPDPEFAITSDENMAEFRTERLPARLMSFLDAGVTTIMDPGGFLPFTVQIRDQVDSGELVGPRMYVAGRLFTAPQGHPAVTVCNSNEWCIAHLTCNTNDPAVARQCARDIAAAGVDGFKLVYDGGEEGDLVVEHMTEEVLRAIVEEGHKLGLPVVAHTSSVDDTMDVVYAGVDGLVHAVGDEGGQLMSANGESLPVVLNRFDVSMTTTVRFADLQSQPPERREMVVQMIDNLVGPSLRAHADAGVTLLFGTDFEGIGTPADPRELIEAEMRVLLASGFSEMEVIEMLTGHSSRHPFTLDDYGTIEAGQLADIIILDGDPLEDLTAATRPAVVIKGGEIVIDKR